MQWLSFDIFIPNCRHLDRKIASYFLQWSQKFWQWAEPVLLCVIGLNPSPSKGTSIKKWSPSEAYCGSWLRCGPTDSRPPLLPSSPVTGLALNERLHCVQTFTGWLRLMSCHSSPGYQPSMIPVNFFSLCRQHNDALIFSHFSTDYYIVFLPNVDYCTLIMSNWVWESEFCIWIV